MSAQTRGLGRGLGALIPSAEIVHEQASGQESAPGSSLLNVPVKDIIPNPHQPRSEISPDTLAELAASIREHGIIQPLIVTRARPTDAAPFQLIAGERRWRAAQLAGLVTVPVVVKEATAQQTLELALIENVQRADLNPLEEAAAFHTLMTEFGLTQGQVADRVGKSRVSVANMLRLLRLPDRIKVLLAGGHLSEGHGRALLGLPDEESIIQMGEQVAARDLTVRQTEELVRRYLAALEETEADPEAPNPDDPYVLQTRQLEEVFRAALGTKVALSRSRRGGKLVIHFYSDEELQAIYEHIIGPS